MAGLRPAALNGYAKYPTSRGELRSSVPAKSGRPFGALRGTGDKIGGGTGRSLRGSHRAAPPPAMAGLNSLWLCGGSGGMLRRTWPQL